MQAIGPVPLMSDPHLPEDEAGASREILRRIRSGDPSGFVLAYGRYSRWLRVVARSLLYEKEKAEGLVQDVWELMLTKLLDEPDDEAKLRPYLRGVLARKAANHNAGVKRRGKWVVSAPKDMANIGDILDNLPLRNATAAQKLKAVDRAMEKLLPSDDDLLRSYYFVGESRDSMCERLGIDRTAFAKRLHRARSRLFTLFAQDNYD